MIRVDTLSEMFDVAQVLAYQPMPTGRRVAVVGNSDSIGLLAADAAASAGLEIVGEPRDLGPASSAADFSAALAALLADASVDSVIVVFVPTLESSRDEDVARTLAAVAGQADKPVVSTFLGSGGVPAALRVLDESGTPTRGSIPSYPSPEEAARALSHITAYSEWRQRDRGTVPDLAGCDPAAARELAAGVLADHPDGTTMDGARLRELLGHCGIHLLEMIAASTADEAVAAGERLGWDVVLKATAPHLRYRPDLADVWRNIDDQREMRAAWATLSVVLADPAEARFVVQPMAAPGVPVAIRAEEDQLFGPMVSFGVSGVPTDLLGDRSYRIPSLTDVDAAEMIREIAAAPLLEGYRGNAPQTTAPSPTSCTGSPA